jgi:hypothetical protein
LTLLFGWFSFIADAFDAYEEAQVLAPFLTRIFYCKILAFFFFYLNHILEEKLYQPQEGEEGDSGIVSEYQFTENNNQFCVQNIVRRPGCETFVIDFSDGGRQRPSGPPVRLGDGGRRTKSALAPKADNAKRGRRKGGRESIRKEEKNEINKSLRNRQG